MLGFGDVGNGSLARWLARLGILAREGGTLQKKQPSLELFGDPLQLRGRQAPRGIVEGPVLYEVRILYGMYYIRREGVCAASSLLQNDEDSAPVDPRQCNYCN